NQSYRLPHFLVETVDTPLPIPVYFMRSVGSTAAVFFWESFITELAQRANIDQYTYRRNLLADDPLALRVLDAAAQASGWGTTANTLRGIAFNCYVGRGGRFKTYVAEVVELARVAGRFVVKRVLCAVDPGLVVNPNTLKAQIEGGIGFALTNTLKSRITFSNGGAEQSNFSDYPLLRIDEMPEIVPIVLPQRPSPTGLWGSGAGAGCSRAGAGLVLRDGSASGRDAVSGGCFPRQQLTGCPRRTIHDAHRARAQARHQADLSGTELVLRLCHSSRLADRAHRGRLESFGARLGQGHARALGFCPCVRRGWIRSCPSLDLVSVDHRVRRRHCPHHWAVHPLLRRGGRGGNACHHHTLLEVRIFLAQPRLRIHAALGAGLLRHCAARRRA